jgi:hypothetical protein
MKNLLHTLKKQLYKFFMLRIRYKHDTSGFYRYSDTIDHESLRHVQKLMRMSPTAAFDTQVPIRFKTISLDKDLCAFLGILGSPRYKTVVKYGVVNHTMLIYRNNFCGYNGRIVLHALNDVVISSSYHLEIESDQQLREIRSVLNQKYNLGDCMEDEFTVEDGQGHKLLGRFLVNATITYMNTGPLAEAIIQKAYAEANDVKEGIKNRQLEKLQVAF